MMYNLVLFLVLGLIPQLWATESQYPLQSHQEIPSATSSRIIVGVWGGGSWPFRKYPSIRVIHVESESVEWEWNPDFFGGSPWDCLRNGLSVNEVKWAAGGTRIAAIINSAALIINYAPGTSKDKTVAYFTCVNPGSHTLEVLPNDLLAVATSGKTQRDGIAIYNMKPSSTSRSVSHNLTVQNIQGFPAVHGLLWDETEQMLWAVGNDVAPDGSEGVSNGLLRGYRMSATNKSDSGLPFLIFDGEQGIVGPYKITPPARLNVEWDPPDDSWWNGPHDLTGFPNSRYMLITTDLGLHTFDTRTREFIKNRSPVDPYLRGFQPNGKRVGRANIALPMSDIKAFGVYQASIVYIQADWKGYYSYYVSLLRGGSLRRIPMERKAYKARWFEATPGWESAASSPSSLDEQ